MTAEQFERFWFSTYPNTIPLAHRFRDDYKERWFRIHSLPYSQRYAYSEDEWNVLLSRQNQLISELLGDSTKLLMVSGEYHFDNDLNTPSELDQELFKEIKFTRLTQIDLYDQDANEFEKGTKYLPFVAEINWMPNEYDPIFRSIANDEVRVFFVSIEKNCLIAPYDGGIDIIVEDELIKDFYKIKYKDWLSPRQDGL